MGKLKIGVDLDGVLYDFANGLGYYLYQYEGFPAEVLTEAKVWNFFLEWGISIEEYKKYYAKGVDAGVVLLHGAAHEGGAEIIDQLRSDGHTIHIVTHRDIGKRAIQSTSEWLQREGVHYDTITFANDKTIVKTDVFIEDNMGNFEALREAGTKAYLINRPWNEPLVTKFRVDSWAEFYLVCKHIELIGLEP